ncbi:DUF1707 SHOCT-like domain-containing protein [Paractinoplanes rishiriensis]|uniref:DUF1707 domain-containing protein n=1 Tax=Paractinoplanes rishiriensis TaxID=1050105 RepID=A0A919K1X6_9ACTN|nr:DUF1707 domain-containing protein [Actinoplanes rishiriensis]GIE97324.1 hypothetical protein Ari01nite_47890 [Actinoplanes rishiriensis]
MGRDQRVGHAERTQVLGLLGNAYEAGLLPVGDYDARVAAVGTATYASELSFQVSDLPPAYAWGARAAPAEPRAAGRIALILGIASVPLSFCAIGGILGVLAVISSRGAGTGVTLALIGRIFGIVGIALSLTAVFAFFYFRNASLGP